VSLRAFDLNVDLGEGTPGELDLLPYVDRVNLSCGGHAGDPADWLPLMQAAHKLRLAVGVHPSYPDRTGFGRVVVPLAGDVLSAHWWVQVGGLVSLANYLGVPLSHLKPHGALYHVAHQEDGIAIRLAELAGHYRLALVGLPGGALQQAATWQGVPFLAEGFADRGYDSRGQLIPRGQPGACLTDLNQVIRQVEQLQKAGQYDTICLHGDGPLALQLARGLRVHFPRPTKILENASA